MSKLINLSNLSRFKSNLDAKLLLKADLVDGKVPASQLPSFVDDVLEFDTLTNFPETGESGKIYVAQDTNKTYRWSGSTYVEISESLALGETASTAYRGDYGKVAYEHSQNSAVHVTEAQKTAWDAKSDFSGSYTDLTNKPSIPTTVAELTDSGNYALKTEIPTMEIATDAEIDALFE